ncbi:unnamed protein product [Prorocentrum cordatum]|uniref:Uncharacterized protein n=1 Tax=Prorocentrum cordatum TaxID=2364126 RepID=A0ABN9SVH0_9DINO|nr:unnamed protein product [Polarella glacialis]
MLAPFGVARESASASIISAGISDGEALAGFVKDQDRAWIEQEPAFGVEIALLLHITGEGAGLRLKQAMAKAMPSTSAAVTPEQTLQELDKLRQSDTFKLANSTQQGKFLTVHRIIGRIVEGAAPNVATAGKDEMLSDVVALIPNFVRQVKPAAEGNPKATAFGAEALALMYPDVKKKAGAGNATLKDVKPFRIYGYLCAPEVRATYDAMVSDVDKKLGSASSAKAKKAKTSKSAGDGDDAAFKKAMELFA